ncbi:armadillo repeat-containing protein 12 isoform X2 [Rhinolophus ferrumequinum]|uniref:armadillo repeat-containing protein 12 isoform X2 n=1 Tax=Rhinolophus ferrumequinum TaxID=59479 RepID=UPI00140F96CE|nr:armadillo repeat-containing protein 12 isoform X2 [Rhinolophus ferrumequinum]
MLEMQTAALKSLGHTGSDSDTLDSWPCQSSGSGRPLPGALGLAPTWAQGGTEDMGKSVPQRLGPLDIRKSVVSLATGAGAIYLLYKAIRAGMKCQPPLCTNSPICIARLAIERERHGRDSGELRRLLNSLESKQDEYARSMILHSITRCVYLLEAEASACTADDIVLVGSMLDDKENSVKIQALNTLKAFSGIRKFRLKIQEHSIKVLELIATIWDSELHIASLRLLNNLPLPDFAHPQLRRVMPALMEILQSDYILAQVQAIRLLSSLAQKNDLLYDILNCQVHSNFLNLFQASQPGSLLFEEFRSLWAGGSDSVKLWLQSSFWPGLQSSEGLTAAGGSTSKMAHLRGWQEDAAHSGPCGD